MASSTEKETNLRCAVELIKEAQANEAALIAFPEFFMAFSPVGQSAAALAEIAESCDGPFVTALRDAARAAGIGVLATIYETCPASNRVFDTAVYIDAVGNLASVYRKLHLYDAFGFRESDKFRPGAELAPLVALGENQVGVMICYDLRFPEMARMLALQGADLLLAPSGWVAGDLKVDHWHTMIKARALENGCYVVAPNQVGNDYIGHSLAVDPIGRILVDLGEKEGVKLVEVDPAMVRATREKLPLLANRRSDVYSRYGLGSGSDKAPP